MKKIILGLSALAIMMFTSGCSTMHMGWTAVTQQHKLDDGAMAAYDNMFTKVTEYGDPARAMMNEYKVSDDVSEDDLVESIHALADEYNMRVTGDTKMFTIENAKPKEVKHARIISLCAPAIAKIFLNHSRYFGGFMPCRIIYVEYGNGERWLVTMDMTLAIHGGYPLAPDMLKMGNSVKLAMEKIPERAAKGDF
jgi:uncharacterized protein (DUF302 family)